MQGQGPSLQGLDFQGQGLKFIADKPTIAIKQ